MEHSGNGNRASRGRAEGLAAAGWQLSDQCDGSGVSRARGGSHRAAASLHVRNLRTGHEARRSARGGRVRDARECDESHAGPRARKSGLRRIVQAAAVMRTNG